MPIYWTNECTCNRPLLESFTYDRQSGSFMCRNCGKTVTKKRISGMNRIQVHVSKLGSDHGLRYFKRQVARMKKTNGNDFSKMSWWLGKEQVFDADELCL